MQLEPKHLAPFLPYNLKVIMEGKICNVAWMSTKNIAVIRPNGIGDLKKIKWDYAPFNIRPILKPLSDLSKEDYIEEITSHFESLGINIKLTEYDSGNRSPNDLTLTITYKLMDDVFTDILINRGSTKETPRHFYEWLCKNHFDTDGLIESGLAIDINTIEK